MAGWSFLKQFYCGLIFMPDRSLPFGRQYARSYRGHSLNLFIESEYLNNYYESFCQVSTYSINLLSLLTLLVLAKH